MELSRLTVELITGDHDSSDFNSGAALLDNWLRDYALLANATRSSKVYVLASPVRRVFGYFALSMGQLAFNYATSRTQKGLGKYPIPVVVLTRLALDKELQGKGVGAQLLREAVLVSLLASKSVGAVGIAVHPIDDKARDFYERFGFESATGLDDVMMVRMKDIKKSLGGL